MFYIPRIWCKHCVKKLFSAMFPDGDFCRTTSYNAERNKCLPQFLVLLSTLKDYTRHHRGRILDTF